MEILDIIIYVLSSAIIITWIIFWVKTKSILGIFGVTNTSNIQPTTTIAPTTTPTQPKLCLENCNNNGKCENGICVCNPGFMGYTCKNEVPCKNNCNNTNGNCILGNCVCNFGWTGDDCSISNINWNRKVFSSDLTCGISNNLACKPGKCCIGGICIDCKPDTVIENNGEFDGQKSTCTCAYDQKCRYDGKCVQDLFYAVNEKKLETFTDLFKTISILYSKDCINWTSKIISNIDTYYIGFKKIYFNGISWIITCNIISTGDLQNYTLLNSILYSDDFNTWTNTTGDLIVSCKNAIYNEYKKKWIAIGGQSDMSEYKKQFPSYNFSIMTESGDAKNWTKVNGVESIFQYINDISYNKEIYVIVGGGINDTAAWSSDGKIWNPLGKSLFVGEGTNILWNENKQMWVAFGKDISNKTTSAWSIDGKIWTTVNVDPFENYEIIHYTTTYCDASVDGCLVENGRDSYPSKVYSIFCNGSIWVAGAQGKNKIVYSEDGKNWVKSNTNNIFNTSSDVINDIVYSSTEGFVTSITYNGNIWVAAGTGFNDLGRTIAISHDGKTWSGIQNSGNNKNIYDIKWITNIPIYN